VSDTINIKKYLKASFPDRDADSLEQSDTP